MPSRPYRRTEEKSRSVRPLHWSMLALGILGISTGSILVRLAQAPPLVVGAWRLSLATLILTPWAWPRVRAEWPGLARRERWHIVLAGVALAIHFATWISSLSHTTVSSSVILVSTNPVFVGLASRYILHERLARRTVVAIITAMVGTVIVSYGDVVLSGTALLGDLLAVCGAMAGSAYILLGREARRKLSTLAYIWPCYGVCALVLLALCLVSGQSMVGHTRLTYLVFLLLAVGPQILGHSSFNWALAHFPPIIVTLALLCEPIGATALAWLILSEVPAATALVGGILILVGIYVASRQEAQSSRQTGDVPS